jgi:predicted ATP-grasp superfamily ATP-dependent carboligase
MTTIVVAATSARVLAECASAEGFAVDAIDLFGDADTRRVSRNWAPLGRDGSLRFDDALFGAAIDACVARGECVGWVPGAGFEGRPDLLERAGSRLALIGNDATTVRRLRDPDVFFGLLRRLDVSHPPYRRTPPDSPGSWLIKDAAGTGGWHIRRWASGSAVDAEKGTYLQQEQSGRPMSATFLANGREAWVLGYNALRTRSFGSRPFVYSGVVGPVAVAPAVSRTIARLLNGLMGEAALRGLGSIDFLVDGDEVRVLEINPRPPASMSLYRTARFDSGPQDQTDGTSGASCGLLGAHIRACLHGELPLGVSAATPVLGSPGAPALADAAMVRGVRIVYARGPRMVSDAVARHLAAWPDAHDLPMAGTRVATGDPLCSLGAEGPDEAGVDTALMDQQRALQRTLETFR